jgi:subtilase family serine protease
MRRFLALLVCGLCTIPFAAAAHAETTWTATKTRALSLAGTKVGPLDPATRLHVAVALKLRDRAGLDATIAARRTISRDAFLATYAPTAASVAAVRAYLASAGFSNVDAAPNRLYVDATATAAQVERAFHTQLSTWRVDGSTLYANEDAASVPAQLGDTVLAVLGLTNAKLRGSVTAGGVSYLTSYTPQKLWKAYDATTFSTGSRTPIAIFAEGDMAPVIADLRTAEQAHGLPQVPVTTVGTGSSDTSGVDEWDMDTQTSTGMASSVSSLALYVTPSMSLDDSALAFNRFAADDTAKAGSASFGLCEALAWATGSMDAIDQSFAEAAAQGQTVFASAGDTGGFCPVAVGANGVPAGVPDVEYPASSPYVVAVGGTSLVTNADGSYSTEAAWLAGGGGPSYFEAQPAWQAGKATGATRSLPDVAMDADPLSGAVVYVGGQAEAIGGTSLSSPLALGVWARLESAKANGLGFASPLLYGGSGFHDVVVGDTGPYPAAPGWDFATGLGSFDVARMAVG